MPVGQNLTFLIGFDRNFSLSSSILGSDRLKFSFLAALYLYLCFSFWSWVFSFSSSSFCASNSCFSLCFFYCFFFFISIFLSLISFSLKKYSPVSILISSILGCCSGGNGVYYFFYFFAFFLRFSLTCLNFGRNLSQFSFFMVSSFKSSRLTISYLMW